MDYKGLAVLSQEDKERSISNIENSKQILAERNCDLAIIIVPDKDHVYPEHMPSYLYGPLASRAEDFVEYAKPRLDIPIVYPKAEFMMYKEENPDQDIYYHYDTHWNNLGAYIAARALLSEIGIDSTAIWELEINPVDDSSYDLANLLSIKPFVRNDVGFELRDPYAGVFTLRDDDSDMFHIMHFRAEGETVDPRRMVLIGDSFSEHLAPYLAIHFSDTYVIHRANFSRLLLDNNSPLEEMDPDLLIYEVSERYLTEAMLSFLLL